MPSDNQALLLQVSADTSRALKQLDRLQDRIKGVSRQADKSLSATNDNLARKFGRGIGGALNQELQGIAQRAGPAAGALEGFGAAGLAAAAALGALTVAAGRAIEAMAFGDELQASADKLQITAEALQELQFAAEETDVPLESLQQGLERLNGSIGAFKTGIGGKRVSSAFEALGITKESLKDINNGAELLPILADRLGQVSDTASQVQIAKKLGIEDLLPLLRSGSDGLAEMSERARELGLVISNETVKALADADRQMELATRQIQSSLRVAFAGLATDIAGVVTALANFLVQLRQSQEGWAIFARTVGRGLKLVNVVPGGGLVQAGLDAAKGRAGGRQRVRDIQDALSKPLPKQDVAAGFELDLSSSGGGKGKTAKAVRDTTLQRQQEIDRAFRDVERDLLNAWQSLLVEAENRAELQSQLLALEIEGRNADLDRQKADIAADEGLSAAKKEELAASVEKVRAQYEGVDALRREAIDRDLAQSKAAEALSLRQADIDAQQEALQLQESMARTASERRDIELQLLDLADQRVRIEQQAIIDAETASKADKEIARRKLEQLDATRGAREGQVRQRTQDPLEEFFDRLPRTAAEIDEAFKGVAAGGLADTIDGLAQVAAGMTSLEDFGRQLLQQLAYEVTRVNLQALLAKAFPGLSEAASGAQAATAITTAGSAAGGSMGAAITASGATAAQGMGAAIVAAGSQAATAIAAAMATGGAAGSGASGALSFLKLASSFAGSGGSGSGFFFNNPAATGPFNFTLPAYASGTNSARGGLSLVGEHGPELINLRRGAQVIPNDILRTLARNRTQPAAPSRTFSQTLNVQVQGAGMSQADARRTGAQIGSEAMRHMALAKRRGY